MTQGTGKKDILSLRKFLSILSKVINRIVWTIIISYKDKIRIHVFEL